MNVEQQRLTRQQMNVRWDRVINGAGQMEQRLAEADKFLNQIIEMDIEAIFKPWIVKYLAESLGRQDDPKVHRCLNRRGE